MLHHNIDAGNNATVPAIISRRSVLKIAVAGAAVAIPVATRSDETKAEPTDEQQLEACIAMLKEILKKMHPEAGDAGHYYTARQGGRSFDLVISAYAPPLTIWDGPGDYEVSESEYVPAGIYFVRRVWSDMDSRWNLYGSYIWDGNRVAPSVIIDPRNLVRKVEAYKS